MTTKRKATKGLDVCVNGIPCDYCPYKGEPSCRERMLIDASSLIISLTQQDENANRPPQEPAEAPEPWTREKVLAEAKRCVCGERDQSYGGPEDSFRLIAKLWEPYVKEKIVPKETPVDIEPEDVAIMMGLLKVARLASNPQHMDSWVDLAGYAACGGEIAGKEADQ